LFKQSKQPYFIHVLEMLKSDGGQYQETAEEIYTNLTSGTKGKLKGAKLNIFGVVVTGKPSELSKYNDNHIIRGAILGATTDQY
jgi:hypothetical protein